MLGVACFPPNRLKKSTTSGVKGSNMLPSSPCTRSSGHRYFMRAMWAFTALTNVFMEAFLSATRASPPDRVWPAS